MKTKLTEAQCFAIIESHKYDVSEARSKALKHGEKSVEFLAALDQVSKSAQTIAKYYTQIIRSEAAKGYETELKHIGRNRFFNAAIRYAKSIGVKLLYTFILMFFLSAIIGIAWLIKTITGAELHNSINTVILIMVLGVVLNIYIKRK